MSIFNKRSKVQDAQGAEPVKEAPRKKNNVQRAANMKEKKRDFSSLIIILKWLIPVGVCLAVLIMSQFVDGMMNNKSRAAIAQQVDDHAANLSKIEVAKANIDAAKRQVEQDAGRMTWLDESKNASYEPDMKVANTFFSRYLTWSSSKEYNSLRDEFLKMFEEFSIQSQTLFPKEWEYYSDKEKDKVTYIDSGDIALKFERLTAYRLGTPEGSVGTSYAGIVTAIRSVGPLDARPKTLAFYVEFDVIDSAVSLKTVSELVSQRGYGE